MAATSPSVSELVLQGFVRVVTNPKICVRPSTLDEALAFVDELRRRPTCHPCWRARASAGLVSDAYHAAVAIGHGCEWVTNDTDFARFPGLRWRPPHQA